MDSATQTELSVAEQARLAEITASPLRALRQVQSVENKLQEIEQQFKVLQIELAKHEEERRLERARRFGASSEAGDHQANLFDEAEAHVEDTINDAIDACEVDVETIEVAAHSKRRPKRKPLPADLPSVDIHHDLVDKACACCGDEMKCIGEKTLEQLDIIPMQAYVQVHHCATYSCSKCDESIKTASKPTQPIPKSYASPGLLAHVAVAKYADGLPLYRQSKQFARLGIELPRNTLASHMIKAGELINPLIEALQAHICDYDIVQMDETPVQVLKELNKVAQSKSYMWVMKGGPPAQPGVVYHYDPGRSQAVPKRLLEGYTGYLQSDGYAGYNGVLNDEAITGLGCWAHVRRKFMDAKKALPKKDQSKGNKITQALAFIGKLYQLEQAIKEATSQDKQLRRRADAVMILENFKAWLNKQSVPPKTLLGKAINYTLSQWPRLIVYTQDGRLNIDNNAVENAIRPFAIGRKNWLFSDTPHGAEASANLYSLIESAKANGLNDYGYLKFIFAELPKAHNDKDIEALLPWHVDRAIIDQQLTKPVNT
jgi:transposase